jgi:hypothetical protein
MSGWWIKLTTTAYLDILSSSLLLSIDVMESERFKALLHKPRTKQNTWDLRFSGLWLLRLDHTNFWDVTPCSLVELYERFGGTYCLRLQNRRVNSLCLLGLLFGPEDGGSTFLRNVVKRLPYVHGATPPQYGVLQNKTFSTYPVISDWELKKK